MATASPAGPTTHESKCRRPRQGEALDRGGLVQAHCTLPLRVVAAPAAVPFRDRAGAFRWLALRGDVQDQLAHERLQLACVVLLDHALARGSAQPGGKRAVRE